jgi:hypothetical protein
VSHPESTGPPDRTPIQVGEIREDPVTRERATIVELPWRNPARRAVADLDRARRRACRGRTLHPAFVERFAHMIETFFGRARWRGYPAT